MVEQGPDDFQHVRLAFTQTLKSRLVAGISLVRSFSQSSSKPRF